MATNRPKIEARISLNEYKELCKITNEAGLKSIYELVGAIVRSFLRIYKEKRNGMSSKICIEKEIDSIFDEMFDGEIGFEYIKPSKIKRDAKQNKEIDEGRL